MCTRRQILHPPTMILPLSQNEARWQITYMSNKGRSTTWEKGAREGRKKKPPRQGQGRDTSGWGSYLQSAASLISDKDIVNQGSKEAHVWALCPQTGGQAGRRTDRVSTSVSHFAGIYRICSKVPPLIIMVSAEIPPKTWTSISTWLTCVSSTVSYSSIYSACSRWWQADGRVKKKIDWAPLWCVFAWQQLYICWVPQTPHTNEVVSDCRSWRKVNLYLFFEAALTWYWFERL